MSAILLTLNHIQRDETVLSLFERAKGDSWQRLPQERIAQYCRWCMNRRSSTSWSTRLAMAGIAQLNEWWILSKVNNACRNQVVVWRSCAGNIEPNSKIIGKLLKKFNEESSCRIYFLVTFPWSRRSTDHHDPVVDEHVAHQFRNFFSQTFPVHALGAAGFFHKNALDVFNQNHRWFHQFGDLEESLEISTKNQWNYSVYFGD